MGGRRLPAALAALALLGLGLDGSVGTEAALTATTATPVNSFSSAPDWLAPVIDGALVIKSVGGIPGVVGWNQSVDVYAAVADPTSNPASGVSLVSVGIDELGFSTPMTTARGTTHGFSHTHRISATIPTNTPVGLKQGWFRARDAAGNESTVFPATVEVDGFSPAAASLAITDGGGTRGRPQRNDVLTFRWTENGVLDPHSVIRGWNGSGSRDVIVLIRDEAACACERLTVWNPVNSEQLPLGHVALGGDYVTGTATFGLSGTRSRITWNPDRKGFAVTLGTAEGTTKTVTAARHAWTPSSGVFDHGGNPSSTAVITEPAPLDQDF